MFGYKLFSVLVLWQICAEVALSYQSDESPIIDTPLGKIQGSVNYTRLGRKFYQFRGIRFAKAPVGKLRFKPPVPYGKYNGTYDAKYASYYCPQASKTANKSEDCLMLDVYTTQLPSSTKTATGRPVIVFIFPGGYYEGGSSTYGPHYFLDRDIVFVAINYRLGTLGYLATGTKDAPGNYGFKDQVLALKWVRDNIKAYGGDSSSITLMGCSAGSRSIGLHLISPMSKGLFHKAIALSGTAAAPNPVGTDQLYLAKKAASLVGCPTDTPKNIVDCLRTIPYDNLTTTGAFDEWYRDPVLRWYAVIEKDFGQEKFLTANPTALFRDGHFQKVPFISGTTHDEFFYRALNIGKNATLLKQLNDSWYDIAPISFQYRPDNPNAHKISYGLRKYYFGNRSIDQSTIKNLGLIYEDSINGFGTNRQLKLMSRNNKQPIFYYRFNYNGTYSFFNDTNITNPWKGIVHMDDLIYLFYMPKLGFPFFNGTSYKESKMVDKLTTLYYNFAKYGNPIPKVSSELDGVKWELYNENTRRYLDINETLTMKTGYNEERYALWDSLFPLNQF